MILFGSSIQNPNHNNSFSPVPKMAYYASAKQKGWAAEIRPKLPPGDLRTKMNQVVHSGDVAGPYSTTYNPYRDHTNSYDPAAQIAIDQARKEAEKWRGPTEREKGSPYEDKRRPPKW